MKEMKGGEELVKGKLSHKLPPRVPRASPCGLGSSTHSHVRLPMPTSRWLGFLLPFSGGRSQPSRGSPWVVRGHSAYYSDRTWDTVGHPHYLPQAFPASGSPERPPGRAPLLRQRGQTEIPLSIKICNNDDPGIPTTHRIALNLTATLSDVNSRGVITSILQTRKQTQRAILACLVRVS